MVCKTIYVALAVLLPYGGLIILSMLGWILNETGISKLD